MLLAKLGWRNLWRNKRRTILTMSAMGVATAIVVLQLGIYDGMLWDMIDTATTLYHGHVKITAPGYLMSRKVELTLPADGLRQRILDTPGVIGVTGRVRGFMLLSFGDGENSLSQPAEMLGIVPAEERTVTVLDTHMTEGKFLDGADTHEIVLGVGLARRLNASIGGEIVAMGQAADGSIAADIFTVAGVVTTNDPLRDASLAIVGRETLQSLLAVEDRIHEWAVSLARPLDAEKWVQEFRTNVDGDTEVTSWFEFLPQLSQIIDIWGAMKLILTLIFYFAVILVVLNTMSMAFFERIREFGIMNAIGLRKVNLSAMIMLEGLLMSGVAGIGGGIVGFGASLVLSKHYIDLSRFLTVISWGGTAIQPRLRSYPSIDNVLMPVAMIIALGVIVALFPAWRLRRVRPMEVLREV